MLIVSCLSLMISIASVSASSQLNYHIRSERVLELPLISSTYAPLVIYSVAITNLLQFGVQYIRSQWGRCILNARLFSLVQLVTTHFAN